MAAVEQGGGGQVGSDVHACLIHYPLSRENRPLVRGAARTYGGGFEFQVWVMGLLGWCRLGVRCLIVHCQLLIEDSGEGRFQFLGFPITSIDWALNTDGGHFEE